MENTCWHVQATLPLLVLSNVCVFVWDHLKVLITKDFTSIIFTYFSLLHLSLFRLQKVRVKVGLKSKGRKCLSIFCEYSPLSLSLSLSPTHTQTHAVPAQNLINKIDFKYYPGFHRTIRVHFDFFFNKYGPEVWIKFVLIILKASVVLPTHP